MAPFPGNNEMTSRPPSKGTTIATAVLAVGLGVFVVIPVSIPAIATIILALVPPPICPTHQQGHIGGQRGRVIGRRGWSVSARSRLYGFDREL